jgi:hypothetical protein
VHAAAPAPGDPAPLAAGDPRWREAAVLGSLWAAAEIVLGSFLHNLKVPLRGHIMTAIGVMLLVAGHRRWPQRGVIWRAGLIAAAMKSASPSAVLLGPMLAIAIEGFAMELATRLAPRRLLGYLLGGALAMSWTMTHRLLSWLLTYGGNLVTVYTQLVAWAERQIGHVPLGAWGPVAALAAVNVLAGFAAAAAGWSVSAAPPLPERAPSAAPPARSRPWRRCWPRCRPGCSHSASCRSPALPPLWPQPRWRRAGATPRRCGVWGGRGSGSASRCSPRLPARCSSSSGRPASRHGPASRSGRR